jgi:hypothetical protein
MTAAAPRAPVVPLPRLPAPDRVDPATQQRRRLSYSMTLAGARARAALTAAGSVRRRQSLQVCSAARLLAALGIRVVVVQPSTAWPRHRPQRIVVRNEAGVLGDLALLTAVPRTTRGWAAVADRLLPVGAPLRAADPGKDDAVCCPVTVTYRTDDGPLACPPRTVDEVVGIRGLVVEVRLLTADREVARAA